MRKQEQVQTVRAELAPIFAKAKISTSKLEGGAAWMVREGGLSSGRPIEGWLLDYDALNDRVVLDLSIFNPFCETMQLDVFERQRLALEFEILAVPGVLPVRDGSSNSSFFKNQDAATSEQLTGAQFSMP